MEFDKNAAIAKIANHYGLEAQLDQTIEECAELILAIRKYKRNCVDVVDVKVRDNFVEEIADVSIMIKQLKYLMVGLDDYKIGVLENAKLKRQLERIKKEC